MGLIDEDIPLIVLVLHIIFKLQDKCSALCRLWLVSEFENFKSRFQSQMQAFMNNRK
ncbi:hypothetical protein SJDPG4_03240 [Porphyromonas gingivalis SJD4]|nr:hypothetical protein SJDPG4_03240 [Porphyromonas gingivalis SJD4]